MTSTETKLSRARLKTGSGTRKVPDHKGDQADPENDGDKDGSHLVGQALDGGFGALRLLDEVNDPGESRLGADPRRPEGEAPRPVHRRGEDLRPRLLDHRHALPGQHRLVDRRMSRNDDAVRGDLLSGTHDDQVAFENALDGNIAFDTLPDDTGGLGFQPHQTLDRLRRPPLGLRLEEAAEDDQGHDKGRPVIVDVRHDLRSAEELREESGKRRIEPGGKSPHGDQGVHVGGLLTGRLEGADKKPAPHPEDDRRRQEKHDDQQWQPGDPVEKGKPVLHRTDEDDEAENDPDRKAGLEVFLLPLAGCRQSGPPRCHRESPKTHTPGP